MISLHLDHILRSISSFLNSERGQALAEFSMILAFIALVCVIALTAIGAAVVIPFGDMASAMGIGGGAPPVDVAPAS
jgi:Flp pilus assembly pilin Flp